MENLFRTRSETANRFYRNFRTGPDNFPILFGFDGFISCSKSSVARYFERNFHFQSFRIFYRWPPVGKPPRNLIFPHRWLLVGYHGLSVRVLLWILRTISVRTELLVRSSEIHIEQLTKNVKFVDIRLKEIALMSVFKKHNGSYCFISKLQCSVTSSSIFILSRVST